MARASRVPSRAQPVATAPTRSEFEEARRSPHRSATRPKSVRDPAYSNVLCLSEAELEMIDQDLEHARTLEIGSRSEIAVLSALTKRYEAIDTTGCLAVFDLIDTDRNGIITVAELERGVETQAVREYVEKTRNVTLKGLLQVKRDRKRFDKVFAAIDKSDTGALTKEDFAAFVRAVALERVRYMRVTGLLSGRCYWGLGLENAPRPSRCCSPRYPLGYCADFRFYAFNNHPLLALFLRDEAHPYTRRDALCAELIRQAYCLYASYRVARRERDDWTTTSGFLHNWRLSLLFVTIPVMLIEHLLFLALACPCLRFERRGRRREACFACLECAGSTLGHLVVWPLALAACALIALAVLGLARDPDTHGAFALLWIAGLVSEYLLTWPLLKLAVQFSLCYPDSRRCAFCCYGCCGAWSFFGFGRWASERRRAAALAIDDASDEAYYDYLTAPPPLTQTTPSCCCVV